MVAAAAGSVDEIVSTTSIARHTSGAPEKKMILILMSTEVFILAILLLGGLLATGVFLAARRPKEISSSRREFLRGGSVDEGSYAVFIGLQIAIQVFGSDTLRAQLAALVNAEDETDTPEEKRRFTKSVASLMIQNQYAWEFGFWEYYNDAETSIRSFNQWRNELEGAMATEPDEMGEEVDRLHRFSDEKEFLVVTLIMIVDNRDEPVADDQGDYSFRPTYGQLSASLRELAEGFDESQYWQPATFASLLEGICELDPRAVERDGIFVFPGTAQDGLSSMDLISDPDWKYLTDHSFRLQS
jgi:hypothetical protein